MGKSLGRNCLYIPLALKTGQYVCMVRCSCQDTGNNLRCTSIKENYCANFSDSKSQGKLAIKTAEKI